MEDVDYSQMHANYTMTEAARLLGLSRARFYQLIAEKVFPPSAHSSHTGQPLYSSQLLDMCKSIRRTGIAFDGRIVRFNRKRKTIKPNPQHKHLATILRAMGLTVTASHVKKALRQLGLPSKIDTAKEEETIRRLFKHLYADRQEDV